MNRADLEAAVRREGYAIRHGGIKPEKHRRGTARAAPMTSMPGFRV